MDGTASVSKGCFVYKNGATRGNSNKMSSKYKKQPIKTSILGKDIIEQPYYKEYQNTWKQMKAQIEQLQNDSNSRILQDVVDYAIRHSRRQDVDYLLGEEILPTAALLTGINQQDHLEFFLKLSQQLKENVSCSICIMHSNDCPTPKLTLETMVYNFLEAAIPNEPEDGLSKKEKKRLKRSQCTMWQLKQWYYNNWKLCTNELITEQTFLKGSEIPSHLLIVMLPDFECFPNNGVQDLIEILSSYCHELPLVLILGIATTITAIHDTLPCQVTSKIRLDAFQKPSAPTTLNEILDKVILSPQYAFRLSGKSLKFLSHIFLYYDYSLNGFIQSLKYCVMEHYNQGNAYALCSAYNKSVENIQYLTHDDLEDIRKLLSIRPFVESLDDYKRIIAILTDDDHFRKELPFLLNQCHIHFSLMCCFLEFLSCVVHDLPQCHLGKSSRDLYIFSMTKDIVEQNEFKQCWQMLKFMSKDDVVRKFKNALDNTRLYFVNHIREKVDVWRECEIVLLEKLATVEDVLVKLENDEISATNKSKSLQSKTNAAADLKNVTSRQDLKEKLQQMSKQQQQQRPINEFVEEILNYVAEYIVRVHLKPEWKLPPLYELIMFSNIEEVKRHLIGAPRAALHMALNNPHFYLQCKCCNLENPSQLLSTLPDISVAFKLHLECGRMINLFDWLQAFRSIVDIMDEEEEQEQINPQIQARFARSIAELQFLGYIKMSKRKTDHATRLTW